MLYSEPSLSVPTFIIYEFATLFILRSDSSTYVNLACPKREVVQYGSTIFVRAVVTSLNLVYDFFVVV